MNIAEHMARRTAVSSLKIAKRYVEQALADLYDDAPGYAGEVESIKEATDNAISILNGEPVE